MAEGEDTRIALAGVAAPFAVLGVVALAAMVAVTVVDRHSARQRLGLG